MENLSAKEPQKVTGNKGQKGTLIMAANAIGNLLDTPVRSLKALQEADTLIFEEDRPARAALKAAKIHRTYLKYNEHGQKDTLEILRLDLKAGKTVCYMSDQGMPTIADPGKALMEIATSLKANIKVIPGPSSITAALAACPFLEGAFHYQGFLSRDEKQREDQLTALKKLQIPIVLMDTPYRRQKLLGQCKDRLGGQRKALLALDISGDHEAYPYGSLEKIEKESRQIKDKLNFVLILAPH